MEKVIIKSKDDVRDLLRKEGIYMFYDYNYNITTQEFEYLFIKSQYC